MTVKKFGLILISFGFFLLFLVGEYLFCSANYRFVRTQDLWISYLICQFLAMFFFYFISRRLMKEAIKEKIHPGIVLTLFLALSFLFGCFLRLTLQLTNGLFDASEPQTINVVVASKNSSIFGASIADGLNSMAYYADFSDWDNREKNCELLIPYSIYFEVGSGTNVELLAKRGFFGLPWVEDYRIMDE